MKLLHRDRQSVAAVDTFLDNMRLDAAAMRAPAPSPRLAATLDGRRPLRAATAPFLVQTPAPHRRYDFRALRPVAVAAVTSTMLFGGLASAGALPKPVQHASAQLGSHMGINLPGAALPHAVPEAPIAADPGATNTPGAPDHSTPGHPRAKNAASGTTTTSTPAGLRTPTAPPVAVAPVPPKRPTIPALPLPVSIPDPGPKLPLTPPHIGLPLPSLPPVSLPLPTEAIHH